MQRLVFSIIAVVVLSTVCAVAQTATTAPVTAKIVRPVQIYSAAIMEFPSGMTRGQSYVIAPTAYEAAKFTAYGDEGDLIGFTIPSTFYLTTNNGVFSSGQSNTIPVSSLTPLVGKKDNPTHITTVPYNNATGATLGFSATVGGIAGTGVPGDGRLYLWIGGTATVPGDAQQGDYEGMLTVSVSYR